MSSTVYTEIRAEVNSRLYGMIMEPPTSNDDLKEFCACLGEYLIARGIHLNQFPHKTVKDFSTEYAKGLGDPEKFQKDLTRLIFVLSLLWDREDQLLKAANSHNLELEANANPRTRTRFGR